MVDGRTAWLMTEGMESSVTYDLPKKEELRTAAELPGELKKAAGGVFKAWKDRKRGS
jgi:hypothetical protein